MIKHTTESIHKANGAKEFNITFSTDIRRYYEKVENLIRDCINEDAKINQGINSTYDYIDDHVVPYISTKEGRAGMPTALDYVCSYCERSIISNDDRYYVHCPHCGKKIDYTNHEFLREGKKP